jgi:threonine dehydrogenase-like Zn-dependent dehydrogenase
VKPGQFVIGSFCISDNTCPNCRAGYQSGCQHLEFMTGAQAPYARVPRPRPAADQSQGVQFGSDFNGHRMP